MSEGMPGLIAVILGVRFPDENQSMAMPCRHDAIAERIVQHRVVRRNSQAPKNMREFFPAPRAFDRRVAHSMGDMVHMCRGIQPFFQALVRPFV